MEHIKSVKLGIKTINFQNNECLNEIVSLRKLLRLNLGNNSNGSFKVAYNAHDQQWERDPLELVKLTFFTANGKREFVPREQDFSLTCALVFITSTPKLVSSR